MLKSPALCATAPAKFPLARDGAATRRPAQTAMVTVMSPDLEAWVELPGFRGQKVSTHGRVRGVHKIRKPGRSRAYQVVDMRDKDGIRRVLYVHHLVAEAFLGPRPEGHQVRHLDGDPDNNRADNLAYGTRSENTRDMVRHGTHNKARNTVCPSGHPFTSENTYRSPRGDRRCRVCRLEQQRAARKEGKK